MSQIYVDSSDDEHLSFYIYLKSPHHVIVDRHYFVGMQEKNHRSFFLCQNPNQTRVARQR